MAVFQEVFGQGRVVAGFMSKGDVVPTKRGLALRIVLVHRNLTVESVRAWEETVSYTHLDVYKRQVLRPLGYQRRAVAQLVVGGVNLGDVVLHDGPFGARYAPNGTTLCKVDSGSRKQRTSKCRVATVSYTHLDVYKRQARLLCPLGQRSQLSAQKPRRF